MVEKTLMEMFWRISTAADNEDRWQKCSQTELSFLLALSNKDVFHYKIRERRLQEMAQ